MTQPTGADIVSALVDRWREVRHEIAELEAAEHPNITDKQGRIWTWWKHDLYRTPRPDLYPVDEHRAEVGQAAWPLSFIDVAEATP